MRLTDNQITHSKAASFRSTGRDMIGHALLRHHIDLDVLGEMEGHVSRVADEFVALLIRAEKLAQKRAA